MDRFFFFHIKKLHYKSEKVNKKCVNMLAISMFKKKTKWIHSIEFRGEGVCSPFCNIK